MQAIPYLKMPYQQALAAFMACQAHGGNRCHDKADMVVIVRYRGPQLPEGATTLPQGVLIESIEAKMFYCM